MPRSKTPSNIKNFKRNTVIVKMIRLIRGVNNLLIPLLIDSLLLHSQTVRNVVKIIKTYIHVVSLLYRITPS